MQICKNMDTNRLRELRDLSAGLNEIHVKIQVKETILCALRSVVVSSIEQAVPSRPALRDAALILKETGETGAALLLTLAASAITGSSKLVDSASAALEMVLAAQGADLLHDCDIEPLLATSEKIDFFIANISLRIEKVTIILGSVDTEIEHLQKALVYIQHGL